MVWFLQSKLYIWKLIVTNHIFLMYVTDCTFLNKILWILEILGLLAIHRGRESVMNQQMTPHSLPVRAKYRTLFIGVKSGRLGIFIHVLYMLYHGMQARDISRYGEPKLMGHGVPCYNETRLCICVLTICVLFLSNGTQTYIYILCHSSKMIWHRQLKSFLK